MALVDPGSPDYDAGTPRGLNVAGFGKSTPMAGGLGGLQIGYNRQIDRTVLGLEADVALADLKGSHTIFSGLGGGDRPRRTPRRWARSPGGSAMWSIVLCSM
jgi:hypothetical protein